MAEPAEGQSKIASVEDLQNMSTENLKEIAKKYGRDESKTNDLTKLGTNVVAIDDPIASVSNYLYETIKNEEKS